MKYGTRGPAHYAFLTLEILFIIGTCVMGMRLIARRTSGTVQTSVLSYMMSGQWARGVNIFAISNIIFLMCQIGMIVILSRFFLQILGGVFGTKGETVCRLLLNMVSYAGVIVFIFMSMSYLGIDTATLLASLGLATFALSLGLKDLVSRVSTRSVTSSISPGTVGPSLR